MSLTDDQTDSASADPGASADSSTADTGGKTLVDAVIAAIDETGDSPASDVQPGANADDSAAVAPDPKDDASADDPDDKSALTDEEMAKLNSRTRDRIDDLLAQRREAAEKVRAFEEENARLKPAAEQYGRIQSFLRDNSVSPQDAGAALRMAALINSNPVEAFRALQPIFTELAQRVGAAIPADLAEDVRLGRITQARAQELAVSRATAQVSRQQAERNAEALRQQQAREAEQRETDTRSRHAGEMARLGDELAATAAGSDPDWKLKEPFVVRALQVDLVQNGMPKDANDLKARFNAAVKEVGAQLAHLRPSPRPTQKHPTSASSSSASSAAPPKSVQEAVLRALE